MIRQFKITLISRSAFANKRPACIFTAGLAAAVMSSSGTFVNVVTSIASKCIFTLSTSWTWIIFTLIYILTLISIQNSAISKNEIKVGKNIDVVLLAWNLARVGTMSIFTDLITWTVVCPKLTLIDIHTLTI